MDFTKYTDAELIALLQKPPVVPKKDLPHELAHHSARYVRVDDTLYYLGFYTSRIRQELKRRNALYSEMARDRIDSVDITCIVRRKVVYQNGALAGVSVKFIGTIEDAQLDKFQVVYRQKGAAFWNAWFGSQPHLPVSVTISRLNPKVTYEVALEARGRDGEEHFGLTTVSFGSDEYDAMNKQAADLALKRQQQREQSEEAMRLHNERLQEHREEREQQQAEMEKAEQEAVEKQKRLAEEAAEADRKRTRALDALSRVRLFLSVSKVERNRWQPGKKLVTFKLDATNAPGLEFHLLVNDSWVGRPDQFRPHWIQSDFPATYKMWVGAGSGAKVQLVGRTKYGKVESDVVRV